MKGLHLGLSLAGVAAFSGPADLFASANGIWIDPSDLSTMFKDTAGTTPVTADGDAVALIHDKSGNGNHLSQATLAARPIYHTDGTLHWLEYDGTARVLSGGDILDLGTGGYFGVIGARLSSAVTQGLFAKSIAGGQAGRYALLKDTSLTSIYENAAGAQTKTAAYSAITDAVLTAKLHRAAGVNRLRVNGATQSPDVTFTGESATQNTTDVFVLGAYNDATGLDTLSGAYLVGRIYGLILKLSAAPSDAEIANAESWLAAKAGVTL